jgi:hypothetical protein
VLLEIRMRSSSPRLTWVFAVTFSLAGCSGPPPAAQQTTKSSDFVPEGLTKTKKGALKGKMTNEVRKQMAPGVE